MATFTILMKNVVLDFKSRDINLHLQYFFRPKSIFLSFFFFTKARGLNRALNLLGLWIML